MNTPKKRGRPAKKVAPKKVATKPALAIEKQCLELSPEALMEINNLAKKIYRKVRRDKIIDSFIYGVYKCIYTVCSGAALGIGVMLGFWLFR